jgi:CheY-like chemotaxis protein
MQKERECLLIDDDTDDQEIFKMCLRKISGNINFKAVNDGIEAISVLSDADYTPDFIFLDVNMPKMNGIECLKMLKRMKRLRNTKMFMYSTTSEKKTVEESKREGAEDFIVKPPKTAQLKEKLAAIFRIVSEIDPSQKS